MVGQRNSPPSRHPSRGVPDQRKMIVGVPLLVALSPPAADVALRDRLRVGFLAALLRVHALLESSAHSAVESEVLVGSEVLRCEPASRWDNMHQLRPEPLHFREQVDINAKLNDRQTPRCASELRVVRLVRPAAELARPLNAPEYVGPAEPAIVGESRLSDHCHAERHRFLRSGKSGGVIP
jgi:hypothetical protein